VRDATATRPVAINNRGQIAGEYVDRTGRSHGYLQDRDGAVITIDPSGAGATVVTDVDGQGRVVGISIDEKQTAISAFMRDPDGGFTTIDNPEAGFYGTQPSGINDAGQIAGSYLDDKDMIHGFVLDNGAYTTVDAPDARGNTQMLDIDDRGGLLGVAGLVSYGYLEDGRGKPIEFDAPGVVSNTFPSGINNRGEVVGYSDEGGARRYRGFLRDRRGRVQRIDVPGAMGPGPPASTTLGTSSASTATPTRTPRLPSTAAASCSTAVDASLESTSPGPC
jgi:hypothetical protein